DAVLGSRVEVAIQPRVPSDSGPKLPTRVPTLDDVRAMLAESGVGDAGLPSKLHLVAHVPRGASGRVLTDQFEPFVRPETLQAQEEALDAALESEAMSVAAPEPGSAQAPASA
ncbi:MAG: hypothetical protein KI785_15975, partial [Devosiaceae bacterium]|nr:hypothetical protein [Devosiaceae bacterium MH13]